MKFYEIPRLFPGQLRWNAITESFTSYMIVFAEGEYTISYQPYPGAKTIFLRTYGDGVKSFDEAKQICDDHHKEELA